MTKENEIANLDMVIEPLLIENITFLDTIRPQSELEYTEMFKMYEIIKDKSTLVLGKIALDYKMIYCKKDGDKPFKPANYDSEKFKTWCNQELNRHYKSVLRIIRVYEVTKSINEKERGRSFLQASTSHQVELVSLATNLPKSEDVLGNDIRIMDTSKIEDFISEYPEFKNMDIPTLRKVVKEYKEANGIVKNASKKAKEITDQAQKDAQEKRDEVYKSYNERLMQMNKREQELKEKLEQVEKSTNAKLRELEIVLEEREEDLRRKEEQLEIKETRKLDYIKELENQVKELESTRDSLDVDILTNKRMLNKLSSEQEKISFIDDTLTAQQIVKQNLQILLKDDMVEYLQTDLINPKVINGLTEVIMLCNKLIKKASKHNDSVVVDVDTKDLIIR